MYCLNQSSVPPAPRSVIVASHQRGNGYVQPLDHCLCYPIQVLGVLWRMRSGPSSLVAEAPELGAVKDGFVIRVNVRDLDSARLALSIVEMSKIADDPVAAFMLSWKIVRCCKLAPLIYDNLDVVLGPVFVNNGPEQITVKNTKRRGCLALPLRPGYFGALGQKANRTGEWWKFQLLSRKAGASDCVFVDHCDEFAITGTAQTCVQ